jgi:glycosyltransferase involved in cell wall biosynthesis
MKEKLLLKMYGFGQLKQPLIDIIAEHHLDRCVTINGGIRAEELVEELSRAAYLVIPSRIESIPVVFSDALQMGTLVIATPAGDLQYLMQKYSCGISAEAYSPEALTRAIEVACCSYNKKYFVERVCELSRKFQVSVFVTKWLVFT